MAITDVPPLDVNPQGGKNSKLDSNMKLVPPLALLEIGKTMKLGADRYGRDNWRQVPVEDHLDHAMWHLLRYLSGDHGGDGGEDHLGHAMTRLVMAWEKDRTNGPTGIAAQRVWERTYAPVDKDQLAEFRKRVAAGGEPGIVTKPAEDRRPPDKRSPGSDLFGNPLDFIPPDHNS